MVFQIFYVYQASGYRGSAGLQLDNKTTYGFGNDDD